MSPASSRPFQEDFDWAQRCAQGNEEDLFRFERNILAPLKARLQAQNWAVDWLDEVVQQQRTRLLVGNGRGPVILQYTGQGPLLAWVRVVLTRAVVAKGSPHFEEVDEARLGLASEDVELALIEKRHKQDVEKALVDALQRLTSRERMILRLTLLDEMSLARVAAMYHVSTATMGRWVSTAREKLREDIKAMLGERFSSHTHSTRGLIARLRSQVEVSLRRVLTRTEAHSRAD